MVRRLNTSTRSSQLPEDLHRLCICCELCALHDDVLLSCCLCRNKSSARGPCLQVLAVYGSWHLGQLQMSLSGAVRLAQCRSLLARTCTVQLTQALKHCWVQVLAVYGSWHLGQLQVGLSGAVRLAQCRSLHISAQEAVPMQIDGEPWYQPAAKIDISLRGKVG